MNDSLTARQHLQRFARRHSSGRSRDSVIGLVLSLVILAGVLSRFDTPVGRSSAMGSQREPSGSAVAGGPSWAVATEHQLATRAAASVLRRGGNAVDATITASFVLGVVAPYGSGIGGGGAMLIAEPGGDVTALDYLAAAPARPNRHLIAIPGMVSGLAEAHRRFGRGAWSTLVQPAIRRAQDGVRADDALYRRLVAARSRMPMTPDFYPEGRPLRPGESLHQPELAHTLRAIAADPAALTRGARAAALVQGVEGISTADLHAYRPVTRTPIGVRVAGKQVWSVPAPAGGATVVAALVVASEIRDETAARLGSPAFVDRFARRYAQIDALRLQHVGDPAFGAVDDHAVLRSTSSAAQRTGGVPNEPPGAVDTTHIVVRDRAGLTVSTTNTLSDFFGSGMRVDGYFLNNALQNFSAPRSPVNAFAPGKRPRTFLAPTIALGRGNRVIALGAAGGRRIPTAIVQTLHRLLQEGVNLDSAIALPRLHVEGTTIVAEEGSLDAGALTRAGYTVVGSDRDLYFGAVQGITAGSTLRASADPRRDGTAAVGPRMVVPRPARAVHCDERRRPRFPSSPPSRVMTRPRLVATSSMPRSRFSSVTASRACASPTSQRLQARRSARSTTTSATATP